MPRSKFSWYGEEAKAWIRQQVLGQLDTAGGFLSNDIKTHFQKTSKIERAPRPAKGSAKAETRLWLYGKEHMRRTKFAPSAPGEPPAIQTGTLRRSIGHERAGEPDMPMVIVGPRTVKGGEGLKYARFLEFGTPKMAARPYLVPAMHRCRQEIGRILGKFKV